MYDPCLLYSNRPFGIISLQTDDTLFLGDDDFTEVEHLKLLEAKFLAKEHEYLTTNHDLKFNRGIIHTDSTGITLTQEHQCSNLHPVIAKNTTTISSRGIVCRNLTIKEQYVTQRAQGAYIILTC
jgi:hypothetical protein